MASSLHPNGSVSSIVALGVARQAAENSLASGATTDNVPEGGLNLYFKTSRARNAISGSGAITYNNADGIIGANVGTTSGTLCSGSDVRLSDARTPLAHAHSITDVSGLSTALSGKEPVISVKNTAFNKNFGTSYDTVCQGNDSRLSDSRNPLSHTHPIGDIVFIGYTGNINVVTSIDFGAGTFKVDTIQVSNGIITNVI